jgi:CxxC motif-containing protein
VKDLICIVCPKGCHLSVDENTYAVTGQGCTRGAEYGRSELMDPRRVITSTVPVRGALYKRCPVKTNAPIPKAMIVQAMRLLDNVELTAPVKAGQVVVENVCGTGIPFITTREL